MLLLPLLAAFLQLGGMARAGTLVQFGTPVGSLVIELYDADKPVTTSNFLYYVNSGLYDNSFFHRLIPGFVVQGGGYFVLNLNTSSNEIAPIPVGPDIPNEADSGTIYSNTFGTIAMALGTDDNTANSQYFFNLGDNSALLDGTSDGGPFTVFGNLIAGTNGLLVFNAFVLDAPAGTVLDLSTSLGAPFGAIPLLTTNLTFNDLIYTDVSIFERPRLQIGPPSAGAVRLEWNASTSTNFTYHVDVATNLPPVWNEIAVVSGATTNLSYLATNQVGGVAFYRLRLQY